MRRTSIHAARASRSPVSPQQRAWELRDHEKRLADRVPAYVEQLRCSPYHLDPQTARAVDDISTNYVMPWSDVDTELVYRWLEWTFLLTHKACSIGRYDPSRPDEFREAFANAADFEDFVAGVDFTHGLSEIRDAEYEQSKSDLRRLIKELPRHTSLRFGAGVWIPLPMGTGYLRSVPLRDGAWLSRRVVELCEWGAVLADQGFVEVEALDPHPLAWHRFYPPDTDWSAPRVANPKALELARATVGTSMAAYGGRTRYCLGMDYWHIEDYAVWEGRRVQDDPLVDRYEGVVLRSWNDLVDEASDRFQRALSGFRVQPITPPVRAREGKDYIACCRDADLTWWARTREAAVAELLELGQDRAIKMAPGEILSQVQSKIIQALRNEAPQTADKLAVSTGYSRSRLFQPRGLKELVRRDPPIVINQQDHSGYRLARTNPPAR